VLRSVGYQGVALPGVPFDERRGVIPNSGGRVDGAERTYAAGWIKRGPSGVIGTNKKDATETVELLLADARDGKLARVDSTQRLESLLEGKGAAYVEYAGWQAIDAAERAAGEPRGRPRVKLTEWQALLEAGRPR
jgi:ferredoxin--NADP+ reductase